MWKILTSLLMMYNFSSYDSVNLTAGKVTYSDPEFPYIVQFEWNPIENRYLHLDIRVTDPDSTFTASTFHLLDRPPRQFWVDLGDYPDNHKHCDGIEDLIAEISIAKSNGGEKRMSWRFDGNSDGTLEDGVVDHMGIRSNSKIQH